tara:strand:- start:446 stop:643 length:198 start_codon:yes stop_codon:yes gene_type:complete
MYKITNKQTQFKQYMNGKDAATFMYRNGTTNYFIEEIKEFDNSIIVLPAIMVALTFLLTFLLLQF